MSQENRHSRRRQFGTIEDTSRISIVGPYTMRYTQAGASKNFS